MKQGTPGRNQLFVEFLFLALWDVYRDFVFFRHGLLRGYRGVVPCERLWRLSCLWDVSAVWEKWREWWIYAISWRMFKYWQPKNRQCAIVLSWRNAWEVCTCVVLLLRYACTPLICLTVVAKGQGGTGAPGRDRGREGQCPLPPREGGGTF